MSVPAMIVAFVTLCGLVACLFALRSFRDAQQRRMTAELAAQIGSHGLWVGAWLFGIAADQADHVIATTMDRSSPDSVLKVWSQVDGAVISHVAGPEVITEAEACGWLEHTSLELQTTPVEERAAFTRERVFALVYASRTTPPVTARTAAEIGAFLARSGLLGATFVACPTAPGAGRLRWIALAAGAVLFFLACLGATTYALASEPPPKPVAPAPRAPASSGTAPAPLQQGTK